MSYQTALRLGCSLVQAKAVRFAAANKLTFSLTSIGARRATVVGPFPDRCDSAGSSHGPLRVALLGCGTVGGGVYQRLAALPKLFSITGVGTRTGVRARAIGVPDHLATDDLEELIGRECDVVIELIGTVDYAATLANAALRGRRHFVTANKALIANEGARLSALAAASGTTLRYSAAVGGVLPALEAIERAGRFGGVRSFSGVLNGTTNYVLDQLAEGNDIQGAIDAARRAGYTEANPRFDLDGTDAAHKLMVLARKAFGVSIPFETIEKFGVDEIDSQLLDQCRQRGETIRLVAECSRTADGIRASVSPVSLPLHHPLAQVNGAENRLIVEAESGERWVVYGRGAGRWPTTEAVMADLFDIRCEDRSEEFIGQREACVA